VPTLVLYDGEVLIESHIMLDYIDSLVSPDRRMFPVAEPARHRALKIAALATGVADKAVSLFYEGRLHKEVSDTWVARCRLQIGTTLAALEAERAKSQGDYWFGERIGHADIAVAAALRFIAEAHAQAVSLADYPALTADAAKLEALTVFQKISQPFIAPA
jgi:glutathione S-transferase